MPADDAINKGLHELTSSPDAFPGLGDSSVDWKKLHETRVHQALILRKALFDIIAQNDGKYPEIDEIINEALEATK